VKRLLVLRHAKSSWADSSQEDWQRPLNERGRRDAPRAGEWLKKRALMPDAIITSDAVRARTTAQAVAAALGYPRDVITHPALYHAKPSDVFDVLHDAAGNAKTVLIVGHNPGLEELVHKLTGEHHGMPTTALVVLDVPIDRWRDLDSRVVATIAEAWEPGDEA
jgi:phosphohistidine phosphatase